MKKASEKGGESSVYTKKITKSYIKEIGADGIKKFTRENRQSK